MRLKTSGKIALGLVVLNEIRGALVVAAVLNTEGLMDHGSFWEVAGLVLLIASVATLVMGFR